MENQITALRMGEKFKQTFAGEIPVDWEAKKLEDLADIRYGLRQPPAADPDGVLMIRAANIKRDRIVENDILRVSRESLPLSRNLFLKEGDIIVVRSGVNTGDVALITKEWAGSVAGYDLVLSPSSEINPTYCLEYLISERAQAYFSGQSERFAQPHLNSQQLAVMPISIPSLAEQEKIAEILSAVDDEIIHARTSAAKTKQLRDALVGKLLRQGVDSEGRLRDSHVRPDLFTQSKLGLLPKSWKATPLMEVATLQRGIDLPIQSRHPGKVPVYGSNGTLGYHNETQFQGPGVVTGRSGTVGRVYYSSGPYWPLNTALHVVDFHGNVPQFIAILLKSLRLEQYAASTGVPSLNRNFIHPNLVAVPPVQEQERIVRIADELEQQVAIEESVLGRIDAIKVALMRALLSGKLRAVRVSRTGKEVLGDFDGNA